MWKFTEHKCSSNQQEIKVKILVKEIAQIDWISYSVSFINRFNESVKEIKRTNNFDASLMYAAVESSLKQVEIWKLTVTGEVKYKMFTLDYIG